MKYDLYKVGCESNALMPTGHSLEFAKIPSHQQILEEIFRIQGFSDSYIGSFYCEASESDYKISYLGHNWWIARHVK